MYFLKQCSKEFATTSAKRKHTKRGGSGERKSFVFHCPSSPPQGFTIVSPAIGDIGENLLSQGSLAFFLHV
jgi:hypothetical protein